MKVYLLTDVILDLRSHRETETTTGVFASLPRAQAAVPSVSDWRSMYGGVAWKGIDPSTHAAWWLITEWEVRV